MDTKSFHGISYLCIMRLIHYIQRQPDDFLSKGEFRKSVERVISPITKKFWKQIEKTLNISLSVEGAFVEGRFNSDNRIAYMAYGFPSNLKNNNGTGYELIGVYVDIRMLRKTNPNGEISDFLNSFIHHRLIHKCDYVWFHDDDTSDFPFEILNEFTKKEDGVYVLDFRN